MAPRGPAGGVLTSVRDGRFLQFLFGQQLQHSRPARLHAHLVWGAAEQEANLVQSQHRSPPLECRALCRERGLADASSSRLRRARPSSLPLPFSGGRLPEESTDSSVALVLGRSWDHMKRNNNDDGKGRDIALRTQIGAATTHAGARALLWAARGDSDERQVDTVAASAAICVCVCVCVCV